jgi:hypothetical protein
MANDESDGLADDPLENGIVLAPKSARRNIEAECLLEFEEVLRTLARRADGRGYGGGNRFDPGFNLVGPQRFQFGDLRVVLEDRIVVVEIESGGGLTNLVKYWPLATVSTLPVLLLHAFGQGSLNDYLSHLRLWDFVWGRMRAELWCPSAPKLFARRFQYVHNDVGRLREAAEAFRRCLSDPLPVVLQEIFGFDVANSTKAFGDVHSNSKRN